MKQSTIKHLVIALAFLTSLSSTLALMPATSASAEFNPSQWKGCVANDYTQGTMNNKCVGYIQTMVNKLNGAKLTVDNDYGPKTAAAVKALQTRVNSKYSNITMDGITGDQTWTILCVDWAKYQKTADAAGCQSMGSDIRSWAKENGSLLKGTKKSKATATTTSARTTKKTTTKACTQQRFSLSKSNRDSACTHYLKDMLNIATGSDMVVTEPFNRETRTVVKTFQGNYSVKDARGVVGKHTWAALCGHLAPSGNAQVKYNNLKQNVGCEQL